MRNLGLDLLRLLAVVLVLGRHLRPPESGNGFLGAWKTGGWVGVDLFFVLSGFLVSGLLYREFQRTRHLDIVRFLVRRAFKIYPAFWVLLAFTVVVRYLTSRAIPTRQLIGEALFLQNYLGGLWNHTWSLAVEEHFYIAIAAIFSYLVVRRKQNPFSVVPTLTMVIVATCLSLRIAGLFLWEEYSHQTHLYGTHIRIDSLMWGVLLGYLWHFRGLEEKLSPFRTSLMVSAGALMLTPAFVFPLEKYPLVSVFGVTLFFVGSGFLLLAAIRMGSSKSVVLRTGGALGASSYSIYLWHMPVATWGWGFLSNATGIENYMTYVLFYFTGSLGLGWIMNKALEWPMLQVRDRLFPSQSPNPR